MLGTADSAASKSRYTTTECFRVNGSSSGSGRRYDRSTVHLSDHTRSPIGRPTNKAMSNTSMIAGDRWWNRRFVTPSGLVLTVPQAEQCVGVGVWGWVWGCLKWLCSAQNPDWAL